MSRDGAVEEGTVVVEGTGSSRVIEKPLESVRD